MIPEYIWVTVLIVAGVIILYFTCLRVASTDWIGIRPPGPRSFPLIGCCGHYVFNLHLESALQNLHNRFGEIYSLTFLTQKVVFLANRENLSESLAKNEIKPITVATLVRILRRFGLRPIQAEEIEFLEATWIRYMSELRKRNEDTVNGGVQRIRLLAHCIKETDIALSISKGEILAEPTTVSSSTNLRPDNNSNLHGAVLRAEALTYNLREIIVERPYVWMSDVLSSLPSSILFRKRGSLSMQGVQEALSETLSILEISTEKHYMLLLFIIATLSSSNNKNSSVMDCGEEGTNNRTSRSSDNPSDWREYGPDFSGFRVYTCLDYTTVLDCNIPKRTILVTTEWHTASPR